MKFGTGFALEAMPDAHAARDFAQTLDEAGFNFVTASGHLLSAAPGRFEGRPQATYVGPFHEPFVLFSYLAGLTKQIEFFTSILILPLFQTAVIAKQAAELSILSGGRFNLGIGISWNEYEYAAVNQNIHNRGRRQNSAVQLIRREYLQLVRARIQHHHHSIRRRNIYLAIRRLLLYEKKRKRRRRNDQPKRAPRAAQQCSHQ